MKTDLKGVMYLPIRVKVKKGKFDLCGSIVEEVARAGEALEDADIIVLSSKFVAMAEGRKVRVSQVVPSPEAEGLASQLHLPSRLAELILREAEVVFGGVPGFALTLKDGTLVPNAGIDRSNIQKGWVILHPRDPFREAERIRRKILLATGKRVGVIITDSRLLPMKSGTIGVAIGISGFDPIDDGRGKTDLFGNVLRVTLRALADDISAGAQLVMGEADEATPIVIVRNSGIRVHDRDIDREGVVVDQDQCIYMRWMSEGTKFL